MGLEIGWARATTSAKSIKSTTIPVCPATEFLGRTSDTDPRITVHFGRIEPHTATNDAAVELRAYLSTLTTTIDAGVLSNLTAIANRHHQATVYVEKAVDVFLAVDLVTMAINGDYDAAYLLSADGDYTPAVEVVRRMNKKVYAVSCLKGAQLGKVVNSFIQLPPAWFADCYR